jgi:hypothetical protein
MNFNINEVIADMANAIKTTVSEDWNSVKEDVSSFLTDRKSRLELLADMRIKNEIGQGFFEKRLKDEKDMIASELHSLTLISKVVAQNAANAAIDVLTKAITSALKIL